MSLRFRILLLVALATFVPAVLFGVYLLKLRKSEIAGAKIGLFALATYAAENLSYKVSGTVQLHSKRRSFRVPMESTAYGR